MARANASRFQMNVAFESVYGTPPVSGYRTMPLAAQDVDSEQPLLENELIGLGSDPIAPSLDAISNGGGITVPLDAENFGVWLKGALGAPVVAGIIAATGAINFSAQPAVNSTVTINGTVFTFVASGATGNQCNIGANLAATMTALAVVLNASVIGGVAAATYTGAPAALTIVHDTLGSAGNAFTLAASTSPTSNGTVSGATLTGGTNTHTLNSGSQTARPSLAVEMGYPEVPHFAMNAGLKVNKLGWGMTRRGQLQVKLELIGQGMTPFTTTQAGTPTIYAMQRFSHFSGSISRNGAALGNIMSADFEYSNNMEPVETIRSDGKIDGVDEGVASLTGRIVARFADTTLLTQAISGAPCELAALYSLGASAQFSFTAHAVYLPKPKVVVNGPGGIEVTFEFQAAKAASPARMCTAVLTNTVATY
jgi:hypothetical protein